MSRALMPTTLFVASGNPGKLRDFSIAAELFGVNIRPLPGLAAIAAPPEDAPTFEGNARAKAIYYSLHQPQTLVYPQAPVYPQALVLADDSGIEVDALNGEPGVRSARYAADSAAPPTPGLSTDAALSTHAALSTDERNNQHLLAQLARVPHAPRTARYRCVLALAQQGRVLVTAEGTVEGTLLTKPRGTGGFGYDPLFYLPELGLTMAEIDLHTKQRLSHRGRALRALLETALLRDLASPGTSSSDI
jgi:XTP/dITP diphosphohydrolase